MSAMYVQTLNDNLFFDFGKTFAGNLELRSYGSLYDSLNPLPIVHDAAARVYKAANSDVELLLTVDIVDEEFAHVSLGCSLTVKSDCRVEFVLKGSDRQSFHILPGFLFGDNNYRLSGGDHFPHLRDKLPSEEGGEGVFSAWLCRADRLAAPVAMSIGEKNGFVAISAPVYHEDMNDEIIPAGFGAMLPSSVIYSLGYINFPLTFVNKDTFSEPQEELLAAGLTLDFSIDLFMGVNTGRHTAFSVLRQVYDLCHEAPETGLVVGDCIEALADVLAVDGWNEETGTFVSIAVDGLPFEERRKKVGGRALAWVGGAVVAYPLLLAGCRYGNEEWLNIGATALEKIAGCWNEKSGLFFDALDENGEPTVNYWWSSISNKDLHSAYTGAQIAYYLLKAGNTIEDSGFEVPELWVENSLRSLDTMLKLQHECGHYGYAYYPDKVGVADWEGFAGAWWIPAMCLAYRRTGQQKYLDSAVKAAEIYYTQLQTLELWGTPMDTFKGNDEEGNLGFMRGVRLLHELTGDSVYLNMLGFSVEYEYLWRYCYNTFPLEPPLRDSGWNSSGGSITSVSNPHIHPMAMLVASEIKYLYDISGDPHHLSRLKDGLLWAMNSLEIYPEPAGYGRFGWTGERYCPSDGLLIKKFFDGTIASTELGLNLWATAAMLEGFLEIEDLSI